jgi:TRAP-type C4-dicarboxylate transport system permease small subunit
MFSTSLRERLGWVADRLERVQLFLCWILLVIMVIVVFSQVLGRYVFHFDLLWGPEVAVFCLCWSTFLGASVAVRRRAHYVFDILSAKSRFVVIASGAGIFVIAAVLLIYGFRFALFQGARVTQPSEFKLIWYLMAFPVAGCSMIIYLADLLIRELGRP